MDQRTMGAAKKLLDKKVLRNLFPLNALSAIHLEEISRKAVIEEVRSGRYVFKKGDRDYQSVYLIEGKVELIDNGREVVDSLDAGSEAASHPLAHKQPRQLSARAAGNVTVARIDSSLLDVLLTWDESSGYDVVEIDAEKNKDWMTRMLQSQAFVQLPPSNIHQLLVRLEEVTLSAGDVVVRQGDEGDYFYIVKTGRLAVSRKASPRSKEVLLAELGEGACFGEEALVSDDSRNASVTMLTDGTLMRLSKDDFKQLLCAPMVHELGFAEAQELISQGARWLDVRLPGEFQNQSIMDSINLPLSALRAQSAELDSDTPYVVCCDTGRRSAAGAFLLRQRGFSVHTLKNGLIDVPDAAIRSASLSPAERGQDAEIIPFGPDLKRETEALRRDRDAAAAASDPHTDSNDPARASLYQQLEEAQKQVDEMQTRLQEAEVRRAEEEAISARVIEQIDGLESDLQRALKERAEFEQGLHRYQTDSRTLETELAQINERLETEQREHEKRARLLEQQLGQIRADYKQLGQRAGALAAERDAAASELQKAHSELAAVQEKLTAQQGQNSSQTNALERELQVHGRELETEKDHRRMLEQQLADLTGERRQLKQTLEEVYDRERDLQAQLQQAEQVAQAALEAARSEASDAQESLNRRITELQSELESQQGQLQAEQSQRDELTHKLGTAEQALTEAQGREQALAAQLQQAEQGAAGHQQDLKQAGEQVEDLRQELDEAQRKNAASEQRIAELEKRLTDDAREYKSDIASVRDALARAQDERENVKRDQKRLMDAVRKAERKLERERQDHEAEVHRLRKELKQTGGESNAGLAAELEALQKKLKQGLSDREELEIKLGERSGQLEDVQAQMEKLTKQLAQAQDSARQAEQQLVEGTQAANEEMTIRLNAEQEIQQALRLDLKKVVLERDEHQTQLSLLTQESIELRDALKSAQARLASQDQAERLVDEVRAQLQRVERERDAAREAEQCLRKEADQLRAEAEVSRGLVTIAPQGAGEHAPGEELEQARRDADLAMRERGEAQEQLLELQREVERLRAELRGGRSDEAPDLEPVQIRSLDSAEPDVSSMFHSALNEADPDADPVRAEIVPLEADPAASVSLDAADAGRSGVVKGLLAAAVVAASLAAGALWWLGQPPRSAVERTPQSAVSTELSDADGQADRDSTVKTVTEGDASIDSMPAFVRGAPDPAEFRPQPSDAAESDAASESEPQALSESDLQGEDQFASAAATEAKTAATRQPGAEFRDRLNGGGSGPSMVELHADSFEMGSGSASPNFDERPRHEVALKRFALGKFEITFEQYDRFAEATGRAAPRGAGNGRGSRPVVNVSWRDAVAYTDWLSAQTGHRYRLPTEAEWEFAARSGTITRYWWGNKVGEAHANCFDCGTQWAGRETAPAGSFPASPFGLHDLAGNAREWVTDCYVPNYRDAPVDGSAVDASECQQRVIRGGSYASPATMLRVMARDQADPGARLDDLGFRVVREY